MWNGVEWGKTVMDIVVGVVTCVGIVAALWQYFNAQAVRRAEWLHKLFQEFYESDRYTAIRHKLDGDLDQSKAVEEELTHALGPQFDDYLNFFEFIAALQSLNQVNPNEVRTLFNYWLSQLAKRDWVVDYVSRYDFEKLEGLLPEFKTAP